MRFQFKYLHASTGAHAAAMEAVDRAMSDTLKSAEAFSLSQVTSRCL